MKKNSPSDPRKIAGAPLAVAQVESTGGSSPERLVHELQVHKAELEMQNEELLRTQYELEHALRRYEDLFEFAPVGYLTLNKDGLIDESNLLATSLFGIGPERLRNRLFSCFVSPADSDRWHIYFQRLLQHVGNQECELKLLRANGTHFDAFLDGFSLSAQLEGERVRIAISDITRRVAYESELREWRKFTAEASWGMAIWDGETRMIRQVNSAYAALHGYSVSELHGMKADELYAPESRATLARHAVIFSRADHWKFECVRLRKDGGTFPASAEITRIQDVNGKAAFISSVRDITENKVAEQRLIESELQYRTLADSGQALIWSAGIDMRCDYFNRTWLDFTGRSLEQELGDGWAAGIHPDDYSACLKNYAAAFKRREKFSIDYRLRHHSGEYRWIQDKGCPRHDSHGVFIGYIGHCLDITALKESEKFKQTILDSVTDQIAVLNHDGVIVAVNQAWRRFALNNNPEPGQSARHTEVGVNYLTICKTAFGPHSEGAQQAHEGIKAVLEARIPYFTLEYPCHSPDAQRWFTLSVMPLGDEAGAVVVTHHDISERKKHEQERIGYLKRQEEASRHLVVVQEDARRRFSAELHDRTSPNLAAIDINLDILASELPQVHSLALTQRLEDTRALIADTAASIREICADLRPPLLDYAGLPAALEGYVQQYSKRTGIKVQLNCANHEVRYTEELESLLFRVFQEALTNCAKHARATAVTVTLKNVDTPIVLSIADNGIGFDLTELGKVGAIGLGMLNMREMAEVAGGRFTIESAPGEGTRIAVEISQGALPERR